jgi:LPXTG-motif cell wall-anchored protein
VLAIWNLLATIAKGGTTTPLVVIVGVVLIVVGIVMLFRRSILLGALAIIVGIVLGGLSVL